MVEFKIVRPESEDWEALYINGELVLEGHSIDVFDVIKALNNKHILENTVKYLNIDDEIAEIGMPKKLEDLYKDNKKYVCPYCSKVYNSELEADKCLDSHSIIFIIEENRPSCDCWGRMEDNWISTDLIFSSYRQAKPYGTSSKYRIKMKAIR